MESDRIEKQILIKAPRARVWRALTDHEEFGEWFGMRLDAAFSPGKRVTGQIDYQGKTHAVALDVERLEPEQRLAWRWHPYAVEPDVDYASEPKTLVSFELSEESGGTLLRIVESGFDAIPIARRAKAYRMNEGGWEAQAKNLANHVAKTR
jgi:uncharacterized protein YndB with AHSA1/START domain